MGELLFYGGIAVVVISALLSVVAAAVLALGKSKLNVQLDEEYGKRRS